MVEQKEIHPNHPSIKALRALDEHANHLTGIANGEYSQEICNKDFEELTPAEIVYFNNLLNGLDMPPNRIFSRLRLDGFDEPQLEFYVTIRKNLQSNRRRAEILKK